MHSIVMVFNLYHSPASSSVKTSVSVNPESITDDFELPASELSGESLVNVSTDVPCNSLVTTPTDTIVSDSSDNLTTISAPSQGNKVKAAGWDFNVENVNSFISPMSLSSASYTPTITTTGKGRNRSWMLNYPALCFLMNGKYYSDYTGVCGMMGIPFMSQPQWDKLVAWLGEHVTELALNTCKQVRQEIIDRGDQSHLKVAFDGFYLTRGHHSNNSSATIHDIITDKII